jgi:hypothetical protein
MRRIDDYFVVSKKTWTVIDKMLFYQKASDIK